VPSTDAPASTSKDEPTPDAISVAGAMLALLGQAMPANASAATGGTAKVLAASVLKASAGQPALGHLTTPSDTLATLTDAGTAAGSDAVAVVPSGNASTAGTAALADLFAAGGSKAVMHKGADGPGVQDLATLLGATPQTTANTGVMPPHALHIASPAGSPAFAQELGQQVAWLGNQDIKQAKIRLHPDELGQVDVSVRVQHGGQVDVTFAAQHPAAVHALQQTLPQLDALLAQHGLSLGQAQVGQQSAGGDGSRNGTSSFGSDGVDTGGDEPIAAPVTVSALGLLDTFA
jgi:flagellar hook-length control protein FliK